MASFCIKKIPQALSESGSFVTTETICRKGLSDEFPVSKRKQKKCSLNVLRLSKTSCFDIQRKFVFWLATILLKNKDFEKEWGKKNPTTPAQPKVFFKDLGEPRSDSKPGDLDLWMLNQSCCFGKNQVFGGSKYGKKIPAWLDHLCG